MKKLMFAVSLLTAVTTQANPQEALERFKNQFCQFSDAKNFRIEKIEDFNPFVSGPYSKSEWNIAFETIDQYLNEEVTYRCHIVKKLDKDKNVNYEVTGCSTNTTNRIPLTSL